MLVDGTDADDVPDSLVSAHSLRLRRETEELRHPQHRRRLHDHGRSAAHRRLRREPAGRTDATQQGAVRTRPEPAVPQRPAHDGTAGTLSVLTNRRGVNDIAWNSLSQFPVPVTPRQERDRAALTTIGHMAVAHLDLTAHSQAAGSRVLRPDIALYFLWALFWLLMLPHRSPGLHRSGGQHLWWQPVLWEGSSLLVATFWIVATASRRPALFRLSRSAAALARPSRQMVPADRRYVRRVGVRDSPRRLCAARRRSTGTNPGRTCWSTKRSSWSYSSACGSDLIFGFDAFAQAQEQRQRLLALQKSLVRSTARPAQGAAAPAFLLQCPEHDLGADAGRRAAGRSAARAPGRPVASDACNGATRKSRRCARNSACWSCTRRSCRSASSIVSRRPGTSTAPRSAAPIPALLLQPLLENAFKHGVERSRDAVRIDIEARRDGDRIHIAIRNTGSVLAADRREGVGLRNCRERLSVLYGDAAQLQLSNFPTRSRLP